MQMALRGLGATGYVDDGSGITPGTFDPKCCGTFGMLFSSGACLDWANRNRARFGDAEPCSNVGLKNLAYPTLPLPTNPGLPAGYDPNTGQVDPNADPQATIDALVMAKAKADRDQLARYFAEQAAINNALGADSCGAFTVWNESKQQCEFSFGTPGGTTGLIIAAAAILLLLNMLKR